VINLAMLGATLSTIVWIGWTVPSNRGEAGPGRPEAEVERHEVAPSSVAPREVQSRPSLAAKNPVPRVSTKPTPRPAAVQARLDVNRATAQEFDQLPGIGPALAQRILDHRRTHGPFTVVEDLSLVKGIGSKKLDRLRELVTVRSETTRDGHKGSL
jgi:competence protein ComEA